LSENIKSFLNYQYVPENFDVVFSEIIKTNKFDLKRSANRLHNNQWVVELYDKCTSNDLINISVDTDAKLISFDIILEHPRALAKDIFEMPRQLIYFGAPGTGKSYSLNKDAHIFDPKNIRRVTFHPSLLYNEFVGGFKPFPTNDVNVPINYYYIPGTLIKSLVDAIKNPSQTYLIIIEELNRANVSAVFGEMFQLLDRDSGGRSQYPIDISED
ncbi:AAA family ATPase, partial [Staphylococcus haemolyticus]|uniref:AAA family ATPase n=2 Tax=Staphylococcus TaxID=1279 RepID=UPI001D13ECF4